MLKKLTKLGNSYAMIIDKPIMDLLRIDPDTPLHVSTDGQSIFIAPSSPARRKRVEAALADTINRYPKMLKRLAG